MMSPEKMREHIIYALLNEPKLGQNYIDWHKESGECGVTIMYGSAHFDITISKKEK